MQPTATDQFMLTFQKKHQHHIFTLDEASILLPHKLIGCSGLHVKNWDVPSFEIGYWVRTGYEGQGYIIEAVNRITEFGFMEMKANRIFIRCDIANLRSQSVANRAGFLYEGTFRNFERRHDIGELTDMVFFALTQEDYRKLKAA